MFLNVFKMRGSWMRSPICGGSRRVGGWTGWKDRNRVRQKRIDRQMDRHGWSQNKHVQ